MPDILFEDNHIIVVNKKCGDIVQGDRTGDETLAEEVKRYIKKKYNKPGEVFLGITHRLDRPTSGIVIFSRTSKALSRINKLFADKEIQKTYLAILNNVPANEKGSLRHYLVRNRKQNKSYAHDLQVKDSKEAILDYEFIAKSDKYYLLQINLHTGRHHQIRAQFAKLRCYIKGDLKYGFPRSNPNGGIDLHAYKVEFIHPVKKEKICIKANPPKEKIWDYFVQKI